jgi:hypothetical protein
VISASRLPVMMLQTVSQLLSTGASTNFHSLSSPLNHSQRNKRYRDQVAPQHHHAPVKSLINGRHKITTVIGIRIPSLIHLELISKVLGLSSGRLSMAITVIEKSATDSDVEADQIA